MAGTTRFDEVLYRHPLGSPRLLAAPAFQVAAALSHNLCCRKGSSPSAI